jgi:hypothetical protein
MKFDYKATSKRMLAKSRQYLLSTPQRRWTTYGVAGAFFLAFIAVPPFGIAASGIAFAGWWLAVLVATIFGALVGNRIGVAVEHKTSRSDQSNPVD